MVQGREEALQMVLVPEARAWVVQPLARYRTHPTGHRREEEVERVEASSVKYPFGCPIILARTSLALSGHLRVLRVFLSSDARPFFNVHEPRQNHAKHDKEHNRQNGCPSIGDTADTKVQRWPNE